MEEETDLRIFLKVLAPDELPRIRRECSQFPVPYPKTHITYSLTGVL